VTDVTRRAFEVVSAAQDDLASIERDYTAMLKALTRIALDPSMTLDTIRTYAADTIRNLEGDQ